MLKASKTLAGLMIKKITALVVAYSFLATSLWSLNLPGTAVRGGSSARWMSLSALKGPIGDSLSKVGPSHDAAKSTNQSLVGPKILTNFAALNGGRSWLDDNPPANCTIHSSQPSGDDGEDDDQRRDEHRRYQHHDYKYGSDDAPQGPNPPITPSGVAIFGQTYTRTTGPTDDFTSTITVPAWASQPFFLHVVNGDAGGNHRVSSATVAINGNTLIAESVFNQNIASIDCAIQLTTSSTLQVDLDSKPGSFLTITALAKSLDHTPPLVTIVSPGAAVNTSQPHLDIRYQDLVGAGETVASGVNTTTLQVLLDGVDRTSLFTKFANEATADLPASLALSPGPHTITASIQDNAENLGQATEQFQVSSAQPVIQILQPAAGSFLNSATPQVVLSYSGSIPLKLASLKVTDQGVDITSSLTVSANGASGTAPTLPQGGNTIVASISDQAGNQASASVTFNVDTTAPTITIVHPAPGSIHGTNSVDYLIQYSDDQAIDPSSLAVSLDGGPLVVAAGAASVSGTVTLNNGTGHVLAATIKDKAGNPATASSTFTVDTTVPNIHIIAPANNSASKNPEPQFQVTYDESISGVNTQSFKASVDGGDLTSLFNVGAGNASATLQSPLADGSHTFSAQIASAAGNVAQTSNQVLIDTIKPQLTIISPAGAVNKTTPAALAQYSDSGSGIDRSSVHVTLDNVDITTTLGVSTSAASGNLGAGSALSETTHQFAVSVADKAGNITQASSSFLVDVTPPTAAFSNPSDGSFTNNPLPTITLTYSDPGLGSGVDLNSIHVFLTQGTAPETEITSQFTFGAAQGTAPIPASSPLAPGTYHLRAVLADKAGNPATPSANFVLDTAAPTYVIVAPAANAFLNTATPSFTVNYQDDLSGVDTTKFALFVDGVDRTNRMTLTANGASGTLQPGDALADGPHQVSVNVFDLAGNQAPVVQQPFLVDTIPPTISITAPAAGGFSNNNRTPIAVTYFDTGSGIDITTFHLLVDSVDHTADLTITPTSATGSLSTALLDGTHSIVANIKDLVGNPATATTTYIVDTVPPQIVITQPADGSFTNATSVTVLGTVTGAAPVTSVTINGVITPVSGNSFSSAPVTLGADGSSTTITVRATDAAGNSAQQTVTVTVDRTPPQVTFTQPVDGSFTNATFITATGTVTGTAPVASVTVNGVNASLSGNSFTSTPIQLGTDGSSTTITAIATDTAGNNSAPKIVTVKVDRTAPQVVINQPADGSFTNAASVTVSGTVTSTDSVTSVTVNGVNASLSGSSFTSAPIQLGADGSSTTITVIAKDSAGNSSSPKSVTVTVVRTPPVVVFTQPADGSFTSATSVVAMGTVTSTAPVTSLTINGVLTPLSGNSFTSASIQLGADGSSTAITASAIDAAGNISAPKTVTVTVDRTQPTITLTTPDTITPLHSGQITATVQDVVPVTQVVISVNNIPLATLTSAPFQVAVAVPAGSNPGDTLTVTATVTDVAGNTALATPHSVRVGADGGVIVGQVLDDLTGLPLPKANVQIIAGTTPAIQTDSQGRYSLQASSNHVFLSVNVPPSPPANLGTTTIEREVVVQPGAGTVPVDARLTTLHQGVGIGSSGGTLSAGTISVSVPSGTVPDGATFQLTSLSGQGLPNLLPLGWSVVAAFDVRSSASPASLNATVAQVPNTVADLVVYSSALHAWTMVEPSLQAVNGSLTFPVPGVGTYSLVVPDTTTPPIPVPSAGSPLTGIAMQALDPAVVGAISLNPPVLPAGGGTSTASVNLQGPTLSPSGTVVQANVSETFSLASGDKVSEETRSEDVVLYNALAATTPAMVAQLPLTPSHKYTNAQLVRGNVHLDILSGREGVRGQAGGNDPVTVTDGIATLSVPGRALGVDTAIAVQSTSIETFVPTSTTFSAIQEVVVDFSGETLNTPAQLSIPSTGLNPADTFLLTQVVRINGVPHMVAAAVAQVSGPNLTSVASPGLPGVVAGGEYVFYDITSTSGTGFVTGISKTGAGPVQALVKTDSLPIVSISGLVDGRYIVPALAGTVNLTANGTTSSLTGTASTPLTAGQLATVDIVLNGVVSTATVSPANKSLGVSVSTIITITSPVPIDPNTIVPANLVLFQGTPAAPGATVPLQTNPPFILSASGTVLTFAPAQNLNPATQYTIQVTGLADPGRGAIVVPASSFTTLANQPLAFDPNAITFAFPDANGNIHVSAPAGSLPAGTTVLIIDATNGIVLSLTAFNDGSLVGGFAGTINDVLQVTVKDPTGATASFTRTQFVAPDGTTAVGAGGGTVTGPGGVQLLIPAGTFDQAATFKIQALAPADFPDHPQFSPDAVPAGGMRVTFNGATPFKQEVKLSFAKPAGAPDNATYFVFRRLLTASGDAVYEVIDEAVQQGTGANAQIVTQSPPYRGFVNFTSAFDALSNSVGDVAGNLQGQADFMIQYTQDILNSIKIQSGAVLGVVRQASIPPTPPGAETTFIPILGATVQSADSAQLVDPTTKKVVTTTDDQGRFTLWDKNYSGGTRALLVTVPDGRQMNVNANEVLPGDDISVIPDILRALFAPYLTRYRNVAYVSATFPPVVLPPPAPALQIRLFQPTPSGLQELTGLAPINTNLTVQISSTTPDLPSLSVQIVGTLSLPTSPTVSPAGTNGAQFLFTATYNASSQALFHLTATVVPSGGGLPVKATYDFRGVQGGAVTDDPNNPPSVVFTLPHGGEQSVDIHTAPQVFFSEPVTNITTSTVMLRQIAKGTPIAVQISGVTPQGLLLNNVAATDVVTSVVLQPAQLLEYSQQYALSFTAGIRDLHKDANGNPAPRNLDTTNTANADRIFQTQGPEIESRPTDAFPSPGIFVANQTAFLERIGGNLYNLGTLTTYDVSNPVQPLQIRPPTSLLGQVAQVARQAFTWLVGLPLTQVGDPIEGRPAAIAGEDNNSLAVAQGYKALVAVAASSYATPLPSNVHLYMDDGTRTNNTQWIGSVSLTSSPLDGMVNSVVVRGDRVYAATWRKGIQVVDINQVIADTRARLTPNPLNPGDLALGLRASGARQGTINRDLYTEGQGFATDAVVNTVPVAFPDVCQPPQPCVTEFNADILSIKVSDYVVAGLSSTWVIGAGAVQPPSTAAAGTNPASVVAVNPTTNEVFRNTPSDGQGLFLTRGWAIDLGQVQNPNLPNLSNIAVVAGTTSAASYAMFVLDMTDPRSPATISVTSLDNTLGILTDVLIKNNVAAVAFRHVTVLYDISDPRSPVKLGAIGSDTDPVGGKLAFSSDGSMLFSSNFSPGVATDPSGGLHIAAFQSGAYVYQIAPVLSKEDDASNQNSTRTNEVKFTINTVMIPMATHVVSAQLRLFANGSPISCPQTGQPTAATCNVNLVGTQGTVTFAPELLTKVPKDLTATVTYNLPTPQKSLVSSPVPLHLGVVKILVDLNNDTIVDDTDAQLQRQNADTIQNAKAGNQNYDPTVDLSLARFGFWESDGSKLNISGVGTGDTGSLVVTANANEDALQDYATLKIHAEALPPQGYNLGIKLSGAGASWALTEKAPGPMSCSDSTCTNVDVTQLTKSKEYLSDPNTAQKQLGNLDAGTKLCSNTSDPTAAPGECVSDSTGFLNLANLTLGDTVALFRCIQCGTTHSNPPQPADGHRFMETQVVPSTGGNAVPLDHIDLDIRPLPAWAVAYSIRNDGGINDSKLGTPTPLGVPIVVPGYRAADNPNNDPYKPTTAFVFVHGYNVSQSDALTSFGPAILKRSYWTAVPMLPPQGVTPMLFLWPGDLGPTPAGSRFPLDEFRALESGVGFADFIKNNVKGNGYNTVQVLGHSAGNMVINNALSSDILAPNDINLYLMYDAAVPAETLVTPNEPHALQQNTPYLDYGPSVPIWLSLLTGLPINFGMTNDHFKANRTAYLALHAAQLGWQPFVDPTTQQTTIHDNPSIWQKEFNDIITPDSTSCFATNGFNERLAQTSDTGFTGPVTYKCLSDDFNATLSDGTVAHIQGWNPRVQSSGVKPAPQYNVRWSQVRSNIWDPNSGTGTTPQRGPWAGLFQANLSKTRIVNVYNAGDCVLNYIYYLNEFTKPYRALFTQATDLIDYADKHPANPFPVDITDHAPPVIPLTMSDFRGDNHDRQYWADLNVDYGVEALQIFANYGGASPRNKNILRQWAEVGFWFPNLAGPLGSAEQNLPGTTVWAGSTQPNFINNPGDINQPATWGNIDLTFVGNLQRDGNTCLTDFINAAEPWAPTISHSYLPAKPFSEVWQGYKLLRKVITNNSPQDPDPPQQ
jgi:hypothetical protein